MRPEVRPRRLAAALVIPACLCLTPVTVEAAIAFRAAASRNLNGSAGSITINVPSGTAKGDVMIAAIAVRPYTVTITPPAGFTLVDRQSNANGSTNALAVYVRVASSSEPASYTWSLSSNTGSAGGIMSFAGVDNASPIDVNAGALRTTSGLTFAAPSVTTTTADDMIVTAHEYSSSDRWTPPTGMTEAFDVASLAVPDALGIAIVGSYKLQAAVGATGTLTATAASNSDTGAMQTLALRPVQCGAVTDPGYVAGTAQNGRVILYWSSSTPVTILRKTTAFTGERPADGVSYAVNDTIGSATVVYSGSGTSATLTGLANDTTYHYKVFAQDGTPCYSAGIAVRTTPSAGPHPAWSYSMAGGSMLKAGIAGNGTVYTSSNANMVVSLNTADGTQSWTPLGTSAAVQGTLTWLPVGGGIKSVQSGTATMAAGATLSVPITAVTLARSVLFFGVAENNVDPSNGQVRGQLTSPTNIQFNRQGSATTITIQWYVAEFASGVSVQRGTTAMTATTTNVAISNVNPAKTFVLISYQKPGAIYGSDDFVRARLTSGTNLELSHAQVGGGNDGTVDWQVVTMASASVQSGDLSFAAAEASRTVAVSAVDPTRTFLVATWNGSGDGIGANFIRARVSSATQLTFDRGVTGTAVNLTWFLVTLNDGSRVQAGNASFDAATTQVSAALSAVTPAQAVAFVSGGLRGGSTSSTGASPNDNPGVGWFTAELTSGTTLQLTRGVTGSATAEAAWFVVEFAQTDGTSVVGGDQSGSVYNVDGPLGLANWAVALPGADAVQAGTTAQLRAWSDVDFQAAYSDDVIFAATRNASTTNNRVFALRASDGAVLWTFNETGTYAMDYVVGMPWVDYARNRLYVTSRAGSGGTQPSLWVINTLDGTLVASFALGHLDAGPTLSYDGFTLYVGATGGNLYAIDTVGPALKWTGPAALGSPIKGFVWEDGAVAGRLYFSTANGLVWCLQDPGAGPPPNPLSPEWQRSVAGPSSPLVLDQVLFVGSSDGKVHQIDLTSGVDQKQFVVGDGASTVGDVSTEDGNQLFVGTTAGQIYKLPLPLP
jgi:outer membrane protein assembly factor BamB